MIRAVSLPQSLAVAVATGDVAVFTKAWRTPYRGLLAIHAPGAPEDPPPSRALVAVAGLLAVVPFEDVQWKRDPGPVEVLGRNKISPLPVAQRAALRRLDGDPERWLYVLTDVRPLPEPVACTGLGSGAWAVPPAVEDDALRAALRV